MQSDSLNCSNCRAKLVELWFLRPEEKSHWKLQASCPWCGDESFIKEVDSLPSPIGAGEAKPDDPTDRWESTVVVNSIIENEKIYFEVKKASLNAKPQY